MLFFFFILGLEIKKEFVIGDLANIKTSVTLIVSSIGGVIIPMLIYLAFNYHDELSMKGFVIPISTDTAIAIGIMSLFKKYFPSRLFHYISCVSVIDDLISIAIITIYLNTSVNFEFIGLGLIIFSIMLLANFSGIRNVFSYFLLGFLLWLCFEKAGIHGTTAGLITAMAIPARPKDNPNIFIKKIRRLLFKLESDYEPSEHMLKQEKLQKNFLKLKDESIKATTPLQRWYNSLMKPVLLIILPLFIIINGTLEINLYSINNALHSTIFWGILLALVAGKPLGLMIFTWIVLKLKLGEIPFKNTKKEVLLVGMLTGIGYTISSFMANLTYTDENIIAITKFATMTGSMLAAIFAIIYAKKISNS